MTKTLSNKDIIKQQLTDFANDKMSDDEIKKVREKLSGWSPETSRMNALYDHRKIQAKINETSIERQERTLKGKDNG